MGEGGVANGGFGAQGNGSAETSFTTGASAPEGHDDFRGSTHHWLPESKFRQDSILFLDDADNEVYKEIISQYRLFCSLYTDRGSHFFQTPKAGGPVDKMQLTQLGRVLAQLGIEHIPSYTP